MFSAQMIIHKWRDLMQVMLIFHDHQPFEEQHKEPLKYYSRSQKAV